MRISQIDGLRGISCVMIILYHLEAYYTPNIITNNFFIRQSFIFVDVFFVLSGFVISLNYSKIDSFFDIKIFLKRRFFRLYPLLFFTASLYLVYFIFRDILFRNGFSHFFNFDRSNILIDFIDYLETILLSNSSPVLGTSIGVNTPSWSISAEFYCYILFCLIGILRKKISVIFLTSSIMLFSMALIYLTTDGYFQTRTYGFLRAFIGFNMGSIVYYFHKKIRLKTLPCFVSFISVFIFLMHMYFLNIKIYNKLQIIILTPIVISFLVYSVISLKRKNILSSSIVFQYLGKISFSIYLNHLFILIYIPKILNFLGLNLSYLHNQLLTILMIFILTIGLSHITYLKIEKFYTKK